MTIKTKFAVLATATAISGWTSTPARAEIKTLGGCYDAVLTWCSATFPEMNCSQSSGLAECDEVFGNAANMGKTFGLILPGRVPTTLKLYVPRPSRARDERDPTPPGSGGGAGAAAVGGLEAAS